MLMLTHHDIQEAARIKLEALREEATRHRNSHHKTVSLRGVWASLRRQATRRALENSPSPTPPSPSASQL
jgi:hypothetical protein